MRAHESDEEFVERIRRQVPANRKVGAILSGLYGILLIGVLYFAARYVRSIGAMSPDSSAYDQGFALGILFGSILGASVIFLVRQLIDSLIMAFGPQIFRIHRLLLKYHDAARKAPVEAEPDED
jgi:hypothetical protein